jgi:hypothetical protein
MTKELPSKITLTSSDSSRSERFALFASKDNRSRFRVRFQSSGKFWKEKDGYPPTKAVFLASTGAGSMNACLSR